MHFQRRQPLRKCCFFPPHQPPKAVALSERNPKPRRPPASRAPSKCCCPVLISNRALCIRPFAQLRKKSVKLFNWLIVYELEGQLFIWDKIKADSNKTKHGISFEEAATVFVLDEQETFIDDEHSYDEERLIIIGLSHELRVLTVVHCWRESDTVIRIISARKATQIEYKLWRR